jgi:hypothetical protein
LSISSTFAWLLTLVAWGGLTWAHHFFKKNTFASIGVYGFGTVMLTVVVLNGPGNVSTCVEWECKRRVLIALWFLSLFVAPFVIHRFVSAIEVTRFQLLVYITCAFLLLVGQLGLMR